MSRILSWTLIPLALAGSAIAAEPTAEISKSETGLNDVLKNVTVSYFGIASGPNLQFDGFHPGADGTRSAPVNSWNILGTGYKISSQAQAEVQVIWDWKMSQGHEWTLLDPRVGFAGTVYKDKNLSVWSNVNYEIPATEAARNQGRLGSVGAFQEVWYSPTSWGRFQLGSFHWVRFFGYSQSGSGVRVSGAITPLARYRISPGLDAQLGYVVNYEQARSDAWYSLRRGLTQVQPGVNWVITPRLSVMPYLIIQPDQKVTAASTSFGAWISGTIL